MKRPLSLTLYGLATRLVEPAAPALLRRRLARGREDPFRLEERLGRASLPRPAGPLAWLHGASVGESLSLLPLIERFASERPDVALLVTSGTRTSATLLEQRLPSGAIHQYAPLDTPGAAVRFVEHWRPELGVFVESELWPNLLFAARASGSRLALMSARISDKSARGWDRAPGAAQALLRLFDAITVQDAATCDWIGRHTGQTPLRLDLKRLATPLPCDEEELEQLRSLTVGRPVLLAASTHRGEEVLIAEIAQQLPMKPLLVVVPRHPERGEEVADQLSLGGMKTVRRSEHRLPTAEVEAYVADTLGELGLFYRLADAIVLGGSLEPPMRGHNPLEPARLGKAVISGQHISSFTAAYAELKARKAVLIAHGPAELATGIMAMLGEPDLARVMGENARAVCLGEQDAFDAAWTQLVALLPEP